MGGGAGQQRGGLLVRARLPQAVQQAGHAVRVVEGGVGGGPAGQRGGLLVRARRPQAVQQAGHAARVVEGGVGGGPAGQRGGLLVRARLPQAVQQAGPRRPGCRGRRGRRPGRPARRPARARPPPAGCPAGWPRRPGCRGGRGRRPGAASAAACSCAPASRRLSSRLATAPGLSRGAWAAGRGPAARRPARARPPAAGCPAGWPRRPGCRGGRGRRVTGQQRGGLLVRARRPQAVQQAGHAVRVVEGGVGGGPVRGAGVRAQAGRRIAEVEGGAGVAGCGGVLVQLGGVPVQAAGVGGVAERGLVAGRGVRGGGGPELRRGDLAGAVRPAVLVQVVREPVQRPGGGSHAGGLVPAVAGRRGRAGRGRMRVSGPRAPLHGTAV